MLDYKNVLDKLFKQIGEIKTNLNALFIDYFLSNDITEITFDDGLFFYADAYIDDTFNSNIEKLKYVFEDNSAKFNLTFSNGFVIKNIFNKLSISELLTIAEFIEDMVDRDFD